MAKTSSSDDRDQHTPNLKFGIGYFWSCPLYDSGRQIAQQLEIQKEINELEDVLSESKLNLSFDIILATKSSFHTEFGTSKHSMVHFNMHGDDGSLGFEYPFGAAASEKIGTMDDHNIDDLKKKLSKLETKCAFIGACNSQKVAEAFVAAGVAHVVGIIHDEEIDDDAARLFTVTFYRCIFQHKTIKESFDSAYEVTKGIHDEEEADKFILLPENGNHDVKMDLPSQGDLTIKRIPKLAKGTLSRNSIDEIIGREEFIYETLKALDDDKKRVIVVAGEAGIGKTVVR